MNIGERFGKVMEFAMETLEKFFIVCVMLKIGRLPVYQQEMKLVIFWKYFLGYCERRVGTHENSVFSRGPSKHR